MWAMEQSRNAWKNLAEVCPLNHQFVLNLKNPTGEKFIVLLKHIFPWCKWALFGNSKKEGQETDCD